MKEELSGCKSNGAIGSIGIEDLHNSSFDRCDPSGFLWNCMHFQDRGWPRMYLSDLKHRHFQMEESTTLEHFDEMEIIPPGEENNESQESPREGGNGGLSYEDNGGRLEVYIKQENVEEEYLQESSEDERLENLDQDEVSNIKVEKKEEEITIEEGLPHITNRMDDSTQPLASEMEESKTLEHFHEMEFIPPGEENNESQEFFDVRRMECHHCGGKGNTKQEIAQHIEDTHNSIFNEDDTPIQQQRKDKKDTCSMCERRFKEKPQLTRHMLIQPGKMPFQCNICNYTCTQSCHLKVHMRKHTGEKPFQCNICNYTSSQSGNLKAHMRKHTGEKPFQCNICNYTCTMSGNLKVHMRKHTGEKPFQCNICNYTCSRSQHWKVHMRKHAGEKSSDLKVHIQKQWRKALLMQYL